MHVDLSPMERDSYNASVGQVLLNLTLTQMPTPTHPSTHPLPHPVSGDGAPTMVATADSDATPDDAPLAPTARGTTSAADAVTAMARSNAAGPLDHPAQTGPASASTIATTPVTPTRAPATVEDGWTDCLLNRRNWDNRRRHRDEKDGGKSALTNTRAATSNGDKAALIAPRVDGLEVLHVLREDCAAAPAFLQRVEHWLRGPPATWTALHRGACPGCHAGDADGTPPVMLFRASGCFHVLCHTCVAVDGARCRMCTTWVVQTDRCDHCAVDVATLMPTECGHLCCPMCITKDSTRCPVCACAFDVRRFAFHLQPGISVRYVSVPGYDMTIPMVNGTTRQELEWWKIENNPQAQAKAHALITIMQQLEARGHYKLLVFSQFKQALWTIADKIIRRLIQIYDKPTTPVAQIKKRRGRHDERLLRDVQAYRGYQMGTDGTHCVCNTPLLAHCPLSLGQVLLQCVGGVANISAYG